MLLILTFLKIPIPAKRPHSTKEGTTKIQCFGNKTGLQSRIGTIDHTSAISHSSGETTISVKGGDFSLALLIITDQEWKVLRKEFILSSSDSVISVAESNVPFTER
jgi:hypothetical protein